MDNVYEEYWQEKKRLRGKNDSPTTPIDVLMRRLGIPVERIQADALLLQTQLPYNMSEEQILIHRPVSPGALIQLVLDDLQFTQSELAQMMGVSRTAIHLWIHGQRALSVENAISLEFYLGIPAHILLRLQTDYQLFATRHPDLATDLVPRHSTL